MKRWKIEKYLIDSYSYSNSMYTLAVYGVVLILIS